jgi:hypothetical protein
MSLFMRLIFTCFLAISVSKAALRCEDIWIKETAVQEYRANYARVKRTLEESEMIDGGPVGKGSFGARYVMFPDGTRGIWKPDSVQFNSARHEVAAARVDHHLDLNKVPVTVKKDLRGTSGSVQLLVGKLKNKQMPFNPDELGFLDLLIDNTDRSGNNLLQAEDGRLIAIDHGISFGKSGNLSSDYAFKNFERNIQRLETIINERKKTEANLKNTNPAQQEVVQKEITDLKWEEARLHSAIKMFVPEESVVTRLKNTTRENWKQILEDTITDAELDAMMERQEKLLTSIKNAESKIGKEALYADGAFSPLIGTKPAPPKTNTQQLNNFKNNRMREEF